MKRTTLVVLFSSLGACRVVHPEGPNDTSPNKVNAVMARADDSPSDFGWIKRWAAIGDSFTAGIGAGRQLGSAFHNKKDWECSRYDQSYPMVLNAAFGPSVSDFQFAACSGDRTGGIYDQANAISGDLDLVIMTAGGNDLCLADILKACVFWA